MKPLEYKLWTGWLIAVILFVVMVAARRADNQHIDLAVLQANKERDTAIEAFDALNKAFKKQQKITEHWRSLALQSNRSHRKTEVHR